MKPLKTLELAPNAWMVNDTVVDITPPPIDRQSVIVATPNQKCAL